MTQALQVVQVALNVLQAALLGGMLWVLWGLLTADRAARRAQARLDQQAAAEQEQERQERRWRAAPRHKVNPARLGTNGWQTSCACGWWSEPEGSSSDALDRAEAHMQAMPQRRAG